MQASNCNFHLKRPILRQARDLNVAKILRAQDCYTSNMHYVYILKSEKDRSLYIGYTPNLKLRIPKHNKKQVTATKTKAPWILIYYEAYIERRDATGREKFLKSGAGWRFIKKQLKYYFGRSVQAPDS